MPAPITQEDRAFLKAILDHPEELTTWLVYADWLDERGDPRAEFLRLNVARRQDPLDTPAEELDERIRILSETLDPNWMLAFDTGPLMNCRGPIWRLVCPTTWDQLAATDEPDIRICHGCKSPVFYCQTVEVAQQFASCGQCVALSTRIPVDDLRLPERERLTLGVLVYPEEEPDYPAPDATPSHPVTRRPWWKFW